MGFMGDWWETAKMILFHPNQFFDEMREDAPLIEFLKFALLNFFIFGVLMGFIFYAQIGLEFMKLGEMSTLAGILGFAFIPVLVVFALLFGVGYIFIVGAIIHVFLMMLGAKKGFEQTFKVFACFSVVFLFLWIPFLNFIFFIYGLYILIIGLSKLQEMSKLRVLIAILLPDIIVAILLTVIFFMYLNAITAFSFGAPSLAMMR